MAGAYDHFVGDLLPGDKGWLPLDENGTPIGPATKAAPVAPALACAVVATDGSAGQDVLTTPTGAPITDEMEANPDFRLPGSGGTAPTLPAITLLTPNSAPLGADLALVITGDALAGATSVDVGGTPHVPTSSTDVEVAVTLPMASLVEGAHNVMVTTPGGTSNQLTLTITAVTGFGARRY
jgi:hypothetical protein